MALIADLLPALGFLMLNVFIPGPNVLNTIATAMGSGRQAGLACALACGFGLLLWAIAVLLGAAALFAAVPLIEAGFTTVGGTLLLYFSYRYIRKALGPEAKLVVIRGTTMKRAFNQAFLVMMSNPKVLTTWLAVISLFPVIASDAAHITLYACMACAASFSGHASLALLFSTDRASQIYIRLARPINGVVGAGFGLYGAKLLADVVGLV